MVAIVVDAAGYIAEGAIVTGHMVSATQPKSTAVTACAPTPLSRVYRGYGKLRVETGKAPRKGFGELIGWAEITDVQRNSGLRLWIRVED